MKNEGVADGRRKDWKQEGRCKGLRCMVIRMVLESRMLDRLALQIIEE